MHVSGEEQVSARRRNVTIRGVLAVVGSLALIAVAAGVLNAAAPTPADFAACNVVAAEQVAADASPASPRTDSLEPDGRLPAPPASAPRNDIEMPPSPSGKAGAPSVTRDPTGNTVPGDLPLGGLAADRINDRAYVAAYEACMRQKGFRAR
jgi:hypothetical protein